MDDKYFMNKAILMAKESPEEVGCGAVIVSNKNALSIVYISQKKMRLLSITQRLKLWSQLTKQAVGR